MIFIQMILSLLPVPVFLGLLVLLDSFKLVKLKDILLTIAMGYLAALIALGINMFLWEDLLPNPFLFFRYIAPAVEESLKALFVVYLMRRHKIGFMVDAAIYGFAVGAGFALAENIHLLLTLEIPGFLFWVLRGFGTAVMHGGTTAIFAIISKNLRDKKSSPPFYPFIPGLVMAILVHSFFNYFLLSPTIMTMMQLVILPLLISIVFKYSEKSLRDWMNAGLDTDVQMLEEMRAGRFSGTCVGKYLHSLKNKFSAEVVVDMFCLLRLHLELACQAKGILLMREAGFLAPEDPEIPEKLSELKYLRNSIGATGLLALSPILHFTSRDLWQFYLLGEKPGGGKLPQHNIYSA